MPDTKFYRVKTNRETLKVKAVPATTFGGRRYWKLLKSSNSLFGGFSHFTDCSDENRIGEAIRLAIPNCINIEVSNS